MNIEQIENGVTVVRPFGRITLGRECQELEAAMRRLVREERRRVVLDLGAVEYLDSMGVGTLAMVCAVAQRAGGELRLSAATGMVLRVLKLTRMDTVLPMYQTAAEAALGWS